MIPVSRRTAPMSEAQLQAAVIECARALGWAVYHTHDSRRSEAGFPDLCMVRGNRLLFAELKSASGRVSDAQEGWLLALIETGADVEVWYPSDWLSGGIEEILRGRRAARAA